MELRVGCKASLREEHTESLGLRCRERRAAGTTTETPTSYPCRQSSGENCSSADRRLSVEVHRDTSPRKALSQSHKVKHSPLAFKYINFLRVFTSPVQSSKTAGHWRNREWHKAFVVLFQRAGQSLTTRNQEDRSELGQWRPKRARQQLSHTEFVLRERVRGCCSFTVGPMASTHAGEHIPAKQVPRRSCHRPEHWGARDLHHRTLSFLHPASGTSRDIAARSFSGVLASWGQRLAQQSTQEKLPDPQGSEWLQQGVFQHWKGHPCKAEDSTDTVLGVVTWLFNNMVWKLGTFT